MTNLMFNWTSFVNSASCLSLFNALQFHSALNQKKQTTKKIIISQIKVFNNSTYDREITVIPNSGHKLLSWVEE